MLMGVDEETREEAAAAVAKLAVPDEGKAEALQLNAVGLLTELLHDASERIRAQAAGGCTTSSIRSNY
jgi:hypothetical protein